MPAADRADHVPGSLVYGPVDSRRFGRSLGVSFSEPGFRACRWGCPYCQLGHLGAPPADAGPVSLARLQAETEHALAMTDLAALDVVTLAGGGEPTDHPDFAAYVRWLADRLAGSGVRLVLLTNADGLGNEDNLAALAHIAAAYVKWDPGAPQGSWSALARSTRVDRYVLVSAISQLRIQSLLFARDGGLPGNASDEDRQRWLSDMRRIGPVEIHLTTVDRRPGDAALVAVEPAVLAHWAATTREALDVEVRVCA